MSQTTLWYITNHQKKIRTFECVRYLLTVSTEWQERFTGVDSQTYLFWEMPVNVRPQSSTPGGVFNTTVGTQTNDVCARLHERKNIFLYIYFIENSRVGWKVNTWTHRLDASNLDSLKPVDMFHLLKFPANTEHGASSNQEEKTNLRKCLSFRTRFLACPNRKSWARSGWDL